jgi:anti-anti-sigma factor
MRTDNQSFLRLKTVGDATVASFPDNTNLDAVLSRRVAADLDRCVGERCKLVLDLTGVDLLSSAGLSVLMSLRKKLRDYGGQLALCGIGAEVRKIFKITSVDRMFHVGDDLNGALQAVGMAAAGGARR